jgi:hypothetical protein
VLALRDVPTVGIATGTQHYAVSLRRYWLEGKNGTVSPFARTVSDGGSPVSTEEKPKRKTWKQVGDERREKGISRKARISRGEGKKGGLKR